MAYKRFTYTLYCTQTIEVFSLLNGYENVNCSDLDPYSAVFYDKN